MQDFFLRDYFLGGIFYLWDYLFAGDFFFRVNILFVGLFFSGFFCGKLFFAGLRINEFALDRMKTLDFRRKGVIT